MVDGKIIELTSLRGGLRKMIFLFVICLIAGYSSGVYYVSISSGFDGKGIEENYLGNEDNEEAETMKFKKSEKEILSIIHSHTIIFSFIFLAMGFLLLQSSIRPGIRSFLIVEPFISILITFGGIWLLWKGIHWMKYLIVVSGSLMHIAFFSSAFIVLKELIKPREA